MAGRLSRRQLLTWCGAAGVGIAAGGCRRRQLEGREPVAGSPVATPGVFRDVCPRWSTDGRQIAFLRATTDRRYQLFCASPDLGDGRALLAPALINPDRPLRTARTGLLPAAGLAWSPDGSQIAFPHIEWFDFDNDERLPGTGIWSYRFADSKVVPLAVHPKKYSDNLYYYGSPQWSSDNERIALIGEATDGSTALLMRHLGRLDAVLEGTRPDTYRDVGWPSWSPDGRHLLFRQGILRFPTADSIETLRMITPGGLEAGKLFALTPTDYRSLGFGDDRDDGLTVAPRFASPSWSADGTRVAFTITPDAMDRTRYAVYVLEVHGDRLPKRVSPRDGRGYLAPVWIGADTLGAARTASSGLEIVSLTMTVREPRLLCTLPTDDFDWSPDRKRIVSSSSDTMRIHQSVPALRIVETNV